MFGGGVLVLEQYVAQPGEVTYPCASRQAHHVSESKTGEVHCSTCLVQGTGRLEISLGWVRDDLKGNPTVAMNDGVWPTLAAPVVVAADSNPRDLLHEEPGESLTEFLAGVRVRSGRHRMQEYRQADRSQCAAWSAMSPQEVQQRPEVASGGQRPQRSACAGWTAFPGLSKK